MQKIMFNDKYGLEQAVLDGRKTMTRREITDKIALARIEDYGVFAATPFARYQVGETVAIAQPYSKTLWLNPETRIKGMGKNSGLWIMAKDHAGWNNKMFVQAEEMPHHIRITNIRVERLQDISDEDCLREGIFNTRPTSAMFGWNFDTYFNTPREAFSALIDKVSSKGTWERNPYVFVYEFELVD